ncbi:hypothetical protein ABZ848_07400 [Streptomyces sp. NPDC047081]|uniref:hypothetical protein n=1 Tax=Streptomyces sp. NPDC047081 TaxID=3154706 RepID=UPI0033C08375
MTAHTPGRPAFRPGPPAARRPLPQDPSPQPCRPGASPERGELVRPLTRRQIDDRMEELGELYTHTSSSEPGLLGASDADRCTAFRQRLAGHVRRPGFELLVAEAVGSSGARALTACAYGFPLRGAGPWWQGLHEWLPENLFRAAALGRLFAIADIMVERRVRTQDQSREWNLAGRLQRRLLGDHTDALGVTLVDRGDADAYQALLAWGWRCVPAGTRGTALLASRRLLVLR